MFQGISNTYENFIKNSDSEAASINVTTKFVVIKELNKIQHFVIDMDINIKIEPAQIGTKPTGCYEDSILCSVTDAVTIKIEPVTKTDHTDIEEDKHTVSDAMDIVFKSEPAAIKAEPDSYEDKTQLFAINTTDCNVKTDPADVYITDEDAHTDKLDVFEDKAVTIILNTRENMPDSDHSGKKDESKMLKYNGQLRKQMDNKAAERNRLYRERHKEEINRRRREIRQSQRKTRQEPIQSKDETEQISQETNDRLRSKSHTQRQQRYYERHREEINKRKRDSRRKNNTSREALTPAERNRNYRERKRQEINERRRYQRQRKKNVQLIQTEPDLNETDSIEVVMEPPNKRKGMKNKLKKSWNKNIVNDTAQSLASVLHKYVEETRSYTAQTLVASLIEDNTKDSNREMSNKKEDIKFFENLTDAAVQCQGTDRLNNVRINLSNTEISHQKLPNIPLDSDCTQNSVNEVPLEKIPTNNTETSINVAQFSNAITIEAPTANNVHGKPTNIELETALQTFSTKILNKEEDIAHISINSEVNVNVKSEPKIEKIKIEPIEKCGTIQHSVIKTMEVIVKPEPSV